jgi:hypothetical protein
MPTDETTKFDKIFDLMKEAKPEEAIEYINKGHLKSVDCGDANGTTPLQYVMTTPTILKLHIKLMSSPDSDSSWLRLIFYWILRVYMCLFNQIYNIYCDALCTNASEGIRNFSLVLLLDF